jgi:glycerol kinase
LSTDKQTTPCYLALDQGSQSSRAMIFDQSGRCLAQAQQSVQTQYPQPGWVEQSPREIVDSLHAVISDVYHQINNPQRVVSAGLATQRSSIVCWNRQTGKTLSQVISWQDTRAADFLDQLQAVKGDVHQRTGLRLNAYAGASKLRWCLDRLVDSDDRNNIEFLALAPLASYLIYALLKEAPFLVDPLNGVRSLLLNYKNEDWDSLLLEYFGIPRKILPQVQPCKSHYGNIPFGEGVLPLELVVGDQTAALFAQGKINQGVAYITIGSGAFVTAMISSDPPIDDCLLYTKTSFVDDSLLLVEASINGAGNALRWLERVEAVNVSPNSIEKYMQTVVKPPIFLNGVGGLAAPFWQEGFSSRFADDENSTDADKCVAVLESILFLLAINLQLMKDSGACVEQLRVGGGLSRQNRLCQCLANLTGLNVAQSKEKEATAKGVAALLNRNTDMWVAGPTKIFYPQQDLHLKKRYQRWLSLMPEIPEKH